MMGPNRPNRPNRPNQPNVCHLNGCQTNVCRRTSVGQLFFDPKARHLINGEGGEIKRLLVICGIDYKTLYICSKLARFFTTGYKRVILDWLPSKLEYKN